MPVVVLLIVLAVIVLLLYKSVQDARQQQDSGGGQPSSRTGEASGRPDRAGGGRPRPRPRARRAKPKVDEAALTAHVVKLREAVGSGFIDIDEAVASVIRQTDGALGEDAARKLLEQDDAA